VKWIYRGSTPDLLLNTVINHWGKFECQRRCQNYVIIAIGSLPHSPPFSR
jgi:hypothetical protein